MSDEQKGLNKLLVLGRLSLEYSYSNFLRLKTNELLIFIQLVRH